MRRFLILLAIILLVGTGYFTYQNWVKDSKLNVWSFVPENTVLVYESNQPFTNLEETRNTALWENLLSIPAVKSIPTSIDQLDTLAGTGNFRNFFSGNQTLITMNITSNSEFDFLYIIEVSSLTQQTYISKALAYFRDQGYKQRTRKYLDFTITEVSHSEKQVSFSYIYHKNFFIGSFTAFLVEDAIRTIANDDFAGFEENNLELKELTKLEKDQGNLYINAKKLESFIQVFSKNNSKLNLAKSMFLDLKINEDVVNMSGFTYVDEPTNFLSNFQGSNGGTFDMAEIIPNETSLLYHFAANEPQNLGTSLNTYFQTTSPEVLSKKKDFLSELDFDVNYTYSLIDQEIGLIDLESSQTGQQHRMMILEINDMGEALNFFNSVGERMALKSQDTVYSEIFSDYLIRKLPAPEFPYTLLGEMALGFEEVYYLQFRNYLVFSNHLPQLKSFTVSIENEDTWNKSIRINRFLEQTNKEANLSVFINTPRVWNQFATNLKPEWKEHFDEFTNVYKNLEFMSFQFSAVDEKFYTNVTLYQPDAPTTIIPGRIEPEKSLKLPSKITTKPWLVLNHNTRSREIFVQDTSNTVYLISEDFEVLWSQNISEPINSPVDQIDYYNNGKLQMIFTTPSSVHILDRTGDYIPEFPRSLPDNKQIKDFTVIDYNNTKNYRFGISDNNNQAYLTDKNVRPLEGWNPKSFRNSMVQAPAHVRINNSDFIVTLESNGILHVFNRRGEHEDGFPIDLGKDTEQHVFITNQNSLESTKISLITKDGELIEINFKGSLLRREQLYKPSTETQFRLIKDVTGDTYLILRQTENRYELLDSRGELLFQKDYLTRYQLYSQYYQLGGGNEFIIFVDAGNNTLYIYDRRGNLITGRPLVATRPVSIMQYENEFQIYRVSGENLELIKIGL